jgi:hypothetical protein
MRAPCTAPEVKDTLGNIAGRLSGIHRGLADLENDVLAALRDADEAGDARGELFGLLVDALLREAERLDDLRRAIGTVPPTQQSEVA